MQRLIFGLLSGLIFGVGLVVSGMSNPAKVLNFLDVAGAWDPSLLFVLGGASVTTFIGYRLVWRRNLPISDVAFQIPTRRDISPQLIAGSVLFGLGWGASGFCPGPAWTALPLLSTGILAFMPSMIVGMLLTRWWTTRSSQDVLRAARSNSKASS